MNEDTRLLEELKLQAQVADFAFQQTQSKEDAKEQLRTLAMYMEALEIARQKLTN